jgi:hypothetical protein
LAYIGGRKAITADTQNPADRLNVEKMRFEQKVGNSWVPIDNGIVTKANTHPVTIELLRSDVPQYNDLPWVPGIHLLNNGTELAELVWNGAGWTGTIDLNVGTSYTFHMVWISITTVPSVRVM